MNEKATKVFLLHCAEIQRKIIILHGFLDNHFDADPDSVDWGDVGSAAHVSQRLSEILSFLGAEQ